MGNFIDKISSYNLFNYLLPGTLLSVAASKYTSFHLVQDDIIHAVFIYYFVGLAVSRVGSFVVSPLLQWTRFLSKEDYKSYTEAEKLDPKIEVLSEQNNTYRTMCALLLSFGLLVLFEKTIQLLEISSTGQGYIIFITLSLLFLFSYKKQNNYVVKRIKNTRK